MFPLFVGESRSTQEVAVGRRDAAFVNVPLEPGDTVHWEIAVKNNDLGVAAWFAPSPGRSARTPPRSPVAGPAGTPASTPVAREPEAVSLEAEPFAAVDAAGVAAVVDAARVEHARHSFVAPTSGVVVLHLDNSYSWVKGKELTLRVDVVPASMAGALAAEGDL